MQEESHIFYFLVGKTALKEEAETFVFGVGFAGTDELA